MGYTSHMLANVRVELHEVRQSIEWERQAEEEEGEGPRSTQEAPLPLPLRVK